jgi:hypothetical protein
MDENHDDCDVFVMPPGRKDRYPDMAMEYVPLSETKPEPFVSGLYDLPEPHRSDVLQFIEDYPMMTGACHPFSEAISALIPGSQVVYGRFAAYHEDFVPDPEYAQMFSHVATNKTIHRDHLATLNGTFKKRNLANNASKLRNGRYRIWKWHVWVSYKGTHYDPLRDIVYRAGKSKKRADVIVYRSYREIDWSKRFNSYQKQNGLERKDLATMIVRQMVYDNLEHHITSAPGATGIPAIKQDWKSSHKVHTGRALSSQDMLTWLEIVVDQYEYESSNYVMGMKRILSS